MSGSAGCGSCARPGFDFMNRHAGDRRFVHRPKRALRLIERDESAGRRGQAAPPCGGRGQDRWPGESARDRAKSARLSGYRMDGVDQAGTRRQIVTRNGEVGRASTASGQAPQGLLRERAGLWPQHEDGARAVLLGELMRVHEIRRGQSPRRLAAGKATNRNSGYANPRRVPPEWR